MVGPARRSRERLGGLALGPSLTAMLVGLTVLLGAIAVLGIGNVYQARQEYEDELARTYELETSSSRLMAAGVIEETSFRVAGEDAAAVRARTRRAFEAEARRTLALASGDAESVRLVRARINAQERARAAARERGTSAGDDELAEAIFVARELSADLPGRQRAVRAQARADASSSTRRALVVTGIAGALALLGALALVTNLMRTIRKPLDDLVTATGRLASGRLSERVEPGGSRELRELGSSFNTMAERLQSAQASVEAERERLATTIESLGDALVICDASGVVKAVNPRAEEIVPGLQPGAETADGPAPLPPLEEALGGEAVREHGDRTLSITAAELDGPERGVVWTLRDISERAMLERSKSDFVATASHELRSPLTSIKGFVELLERSDSLGEREREFVGVILQSTDRLVELVNDLLDVARIESGRMEVHPRLFDLPEVVREVATLLAPRVAAKDQRLDLELPASLPRALADPVRVRQILTNLLSNAHQYTPEAGRILVSVEPDDRHDRLVLSVADDGRGMSEAEIGLVFERFVRREDGSGGTGLGLSIVRSLVDLQGGTIAVESEPGTGTTFKVALPAETGLSRGRSPRQSIRGKRVLVVDDEAETAALIASQLAPYDVETEIVLSGEAALERMRAERFDAVTLDLLMGPVGGIEVLREMRGDPALRRTPVVVVSALSGHEALIGEWRVSKPVEGDELADALGSAVLVGRTSVLVVGRSALRPRLEPSLVRLGLDHEWVTSAPAAARACGRRRFEVGLVDSGIRSPEAVLRALDLRGRRQGQAVLVFDAGDGGGEIAGLGHEPVPIEQAALSVLDALGPDLPRPLAGPATATTLGREVPR